MYIVNCPIVIDKNSISMDYEYKIAALFLNK